jgi:Tol biopolymer transport system component
MQMPQAQPPRRSSRLGLVVVPVIMLLMMAVGLLITAPQPPFQGELTYASGRSVTMNLFARQGGFHGVLSNLTGQNPRVLNGQVASGSAFDWTADGARVVFANLVDGHKQIFRMNADGSDLLMLTDTPETSNTDPEWSPNGEHILFTSDRDGDMEIYVMNADGSNARNLTQLSEADDAFAAWSSDGTLIAFASDRDGDWDIYVMNADGSGTVLLTENNIDDQAPAWSPDGTQISFQSNRVRKLGPGTVPGSGGAITARNWDIYVMDANGEGTLALTRSPASDRFPVWSPDGAQIVFVSDRNGDNDIYLKNLNDRNRDILLVDDVDGDPFPTWRS